MPASTDLLQGTLDLLILQTLLPGPMHGWGVALRIQQISKDVLQIGPVSYTHLVARLQIFREFDVLEEWLGLGRPAVRRAMPWLGATLGLGLLFLLGQILAWRQLTAQGFAFDRWATPASYFFYVITGLHAAHLALGIVALVVLSLIHI